MQLFKKKNPMQQRTWLRLCGTGLQSSHSGRRLPPAPCGTASCGLPPAALVRWCLV